jgi:hypothetical protein
MASIDAKKFTGPGPMRLKLHQKFFFFLYPLLNDAWLAMASSPFSLQLQWKMFAAD